MLEDVINSLVVVVLSMLFMYKWIIIITSLISWFNLSSNPIINFMHAITEPVYSFIRRYINTVFANMDLAPIIVFFVIIFAEELIKNIIL